MVHDGRGGPGRRGGAEHGEEESRTNRSGMDGSERRRGETATVSSAPDPDQIERGWSGDVWGGGKWGDGG